ncbi:hypothetical protein SERLA73DRAFT_76189 [Serpula lacrymans var. lacrymans S7.3]|uniref:Uncharacterized protein n=2 Tax=Serpula lacrymans var. lacrymans TaxID=341189 RepID=F8Q6H3_SERL3|nr:uncharacterized protein SERLADRAFT_440982 [Serpula lacrymans var. lacrymans S7.9]EGN96211.1 hypothetical protein SERLA73DRAFT_76189 [Serpula lacrymans var. lacrymans S7.3]EGO21751.1 hypothetical protein SERLADRAFT_440982 [Serpula lacrymans var. lacrymans S7.9]
MSTSHSTGFPVTTYSVPGEANMLANDQVSFTRGQQHNQADVSDAIELMSAKDAYIYLFYETEKCYPHVYHTLSSMHTFLAIDLRAFAAQQSGLEYLSGTPDGKISFGIFGMTLEDELLEWADRRGKGIFGISETAVRVLLVTQQPPPTQLAGEYAPTVPTSPILQESNHFSPHSNGSNPKPRPSQSPPPQPVPNAQTCCLMNRRGAQCSRQELILQIPAARTPSKCQSHTLKKQKGSLPGAMRSPEAGSPSNPINVDDAKMIDQLYTGTYDLGDDNPPTPQFNTSSNTQRKYHQGVRNNAPYCQICGWSDYRTYYCEAYYCPDCN